MTENDLQDILADYVAATPEDGFSDALMRTLKAEEQSVDITDYVATLHRPWRGWLVALIIGLIAGLLWNKTGVAISDFVPGTEALGGEGARWELYAVAAATVAISLLFVELDRV